MYSLITSFRNATTSDSSVMLKKLQTFTAGVLKIRFQYDDIFDIYEFNCKLKIENRNNQYETNCDLNLNLQAKKLGSSTSRTQGIHWFDDNWSCCIAVNFL
jgi:hypothetical protein